MVVVRRIGHPGSTRRLLISIGLLVVAGGLLWAEYDDVTINLSTNNLGAPASFLSAWREQVRQQCRAAKSKTDVERIDLTSALSSSAALATVERPSLRFCDHVVLDFGANVGDTAGHVIDAGLMGCDRKDLGIERPPAHFDGHQYQLSLDGRRNPLTAQLTSIFAGQASAPEDYCYYGIEGNPVFTERLQKLETMLNGMQPRPLKHVHFLTSSVGAGEDGPTTLYLDTVNAAQNYWGSSLLVGHQDVRASNATDVEVMGYTLPTLMKQTLAEGPRSHLILKIDIEGGEYALLRQVADDGALCRFIARGGRVDAYVEFHSQRVTGPNPLAKHKKSTRQTLEACGVVFRNLAAWWA